MPFALIKCKGVSRLFVIVAKEPNWVGEKSVPKQNRTRDNDTDSLRAVLTACKIGHRRLKALDLVAGVYNVAANCFAQQSRQKQQQQQQKPSPHA